GNVPAGKIQRAAQSRRPVDRAGRQAARQCAPVPGVDGEGHRREAGGGHCAARQGAHPRGAPDHAAAARDGCYLARGGAVSSRRQGDPDRQPHDHGDARDGGPGVVARHAAVERADAGESEGGRLLGPFCAEGIAARGEVQMTRRCGWARGDKYIAYHDEEWGVPLHDDRALFEMLILEGAQAGLSWSTILNKRERYRKVFDGFDARKVARYGERKVASLLKDPGIVRNRLKVQAAVTNAKAFLAVRKEFGTFDAYIWSFVAGRPVQ